jgi:hypothetical protein
MGMDYIASAVHAEASVMKTVMTAIALARCVGVAAHAQQPHDFSQVQIRTTKLAGNFYTLGYPNIDRANGGTMNGMLAAFDAIVALARPDTKIVPGHGAVADKTAVAAHKAMMIAVRDKVAVLVRQNKTQDGVIAAKPTVAFDGSVTGAPVVSRCNPRHECSLAPTSGVNFGR